MATDKERIQLILAQADDLLDIKTTEGKILYELKKKEIAQGFREGWLDLNDEIRKDETAPWFSILETWGKTEFDLKVFIDAPKAFASKYGTSGAMIVGGIAAGIVIMLSAMTGPQVDIMDYVFLRTGDMGIVIGVFEAILAGVVGAVIGYASGYGLGLLIGSSQKDKYKIPTNRSPLPDWVKLSPTFLTPEARSDAESSILSGTCFLCDEPIRGKKLDMKNLSKDHPVIGSKCNSCDAFLCHAHQKELNKIDQSSCPKCGALRKGNVTVILKL
jgi:hypothetical protein